jgi:hypothetical protein
LASARSLLCRRCSLLRLDVDDVGVVGLRALARAPVVLSCRREAQVVASAGDPRTPRGLASPSTPSSMGVGLPVASSGLMDIPEPTSSKSRPFVSMRAGGFQLWCCVGGCAACCRFGMDGRCGSGVQCGTAGRCCAGSRFHAPRFQCLDGWDPLVCRQAWWLRRWWSAR